MMEMNNSYKCRVALVENIEAGFVWIGKPKVESRTIVRINNCKKNGKVVYCQALNIDNNFVKKYNEEKSTTTIKKDGDYIVANKWYRDKLGIEKNKEAKLLIRTKGKTQKFWWAYKAARSHPENSIRLSALLAILSLFLGVVGMIMGVVALYLNIMDNELQHMLKKQVEISNNIDKIERECSKFTENLNTTKKNQQNISKIITNIELKINEIEKVMNSNVDLLNKISVQKNVEEK